MFITPCWGWTQPTEEAGSTVYPIGETKRSMWKIQGDTRSENDLHSWWINSTYRSVYYTGWWFGTFFIFHSIWDNPSHWLIFFKMVKTTNQYMSKCLVFFFCHLYKTLSHHEFEVQHCSSPQQQLVSSSVELEVLHPALMALPSKNEVHSTVFFSVCVCGVGGAAPRKTSSPRCSSFPYHVQSCSHHFR